MQMDVALLLKLSVSFEVQVSRLIFQGADVVDGILKADGI
jgi:hypothetical protein